MPKATSDWKRLKFDGDVIYGTTPLVVVKFADALHLPYQDRLERVLDKFGVTEWKELATRFPGLTISRLYRNFGPEVLERNTRAAMANDPKFKVPRLTNFFAVYCPEPINSQEVAEAINAWPSVDIAYDDGRPLRPPADATVDPDSIYQGYLRPAPLGVDAEFAWTVNGGAGQGQKLVDLEQGWQWNDDLKIATSDLIYGESGPFFDHGTQVVGIVNAMDNDRRIVGIASDAVVKLASAWVPGETELNISGAIQAVTDTMEAGQVLLIEAQKEVTLGPNVPHLLNMPVEAAYAEYVAIQVAVAKGIVVVECAGNGSRELDTTALRGPGNRTFAIRRSTSRDSGAIMVGAARMTQRDPVQWVRQEDSNHGTRIDCYAWGEGIYSTLSSRTASGIAKGFGGTSGAGAIIAGVVLAVQGMRRGKQQQRLSPREVREILRNPNLGCGQLDGLGSMPNLKKIAQHLGLA